MNTYPDLPLDLHWSSQDLADAVPLRLHEMFPFDAGVDSNAVNDNRYSTRAHREWRGRYLHQNALTMLFRVCN